MRDSIGGVRRGAHPGAQEQQAPIPQIHITYGEYNVEDRKGMNYLVRRLVTGDTAAISVDMAAISVDTHEQVSTFMVRVPGDSEEFARAANPKINVKLEYRGFDPRDQEAMVLRLASLVLDPFEEGPVKPTPRYE